MTLEEVRRRFLEYTDPALRSICQQVARDAELLALAAKARDGSYMPYFFLSCVRYLFLKDSRHPLAAAVISGEVSPAQYPLFRSYCLEQAPTLKRLLATARTQTNDVQRSAVLFPAFCLASKRSGGRPLGLVEVGASAALNLCWDKYCHHYGELGCFGAKDSPVQLRLDWRGAPPSHSLLSVPKVGARIAIDLEPIDLENEDQVCWLRSFTTDTSGLLEAAIGVARGTQIRTIRGDAVEQLASAVESLPPEVTACVFHSYCTYQFSEPAYQRFGALIAQLGQTRALHWISLEGQSLELASFRPGHAPTRDLLATTDLVGGVHRFFSWNYAGNT